MPSDTSVLLQVLHFFNAPATSTEDDIAGVFEQTENCPKPVRVRVFPVKPGARSAAGLVEFDQVSDACEALVLANHTTVKHNGKLCCHFSRALGVKSLSYTLVIQKQYALLLIALERVKTRSMVTHLGSCVPPFISGNSAFIAAIASGFFPQTEYRSLE